MRKLIRFGAAMALLAVLFCFGGLLADKEALRNDLIRLHVVANSDLQEDQQIKLSVRDAVVAYLQPLTEGLEDKEQAMALLREQLGKIEEIANQTLAKLGSNDRAKVTLEEESFDTREYETFSLPAGVYDSLKVRIGEGEGKNWWCVVFPSLCLPATTEEFQDTAAASGFDDTLTETLAGTEEYEIRFFLLDCIGKVENFFHKT